jgi:hypothetical protein
MRKNIRWGGGGYTDESDMEMKGREIKTLVVIVKQNGQ